MRLPKEQHFALKFWPKSPTKARPKCTKSPSSFLQIFHSLRSSWSSQTEKGKHCYCAYAAADYLVSVTDVSSCRLAEGFVLASTEVLSQLKLLSYSWGGEYKSLRFYTGGAFLTPFHYSCFLLEGASRPASCRVVRGEREIPFYLRMGLPLGYQSYL